MDIANVEGLTTEACLAADANKSNFFTDKDLASQAIINFATPPAQTPSVPEPGTVALSASAVLAVVMFMRRSAKAAELKICKSRRA